MSAFISLAVFVLCMIFVVHLAIPGATFADKVATIIVWVKQFIVNVDEKVKKEEDARRNHPGHNARPS